jgi:hypothetical protein
MAFMYDPKQDTGPRGGCLMLFVVVLAMIGSGVYLLSLVLA